MDFDAKYREKFSSHIPLFLHDNHPKPKDEFALLGGGFQSSKGTNFLQDNFHPIENNFFILNGSSSSTHNPIFPLQSTCFEAYENPTYGCLASLDHYENKPLGNYHAGSSSTLMPLIDNFSVRNTGRAEILGHSHQLMVTPINMMTPNSLSYNPFSYREFGLTMYKSSDEGSCLSRNKIDVNSAPSSLTTSTMVKKGARGRKKNAHEVVKGQWTLQEDRLLIKLVQRYGVRKWSQIAQLLNGRIGKQCRERWHNHLRPDIKKDIWSEEEDRILIKAHSEIGNKWAEIAKILPGRTENSIKNHWNATKRKQFCRRTCRSKYPRQSSLLQDYIKSLSPETINAGCRKKLLPKTNQNTTTTIENNPKSSTDQTVGSSDSSSINRLGGHEYDYDDVPDFNFDAHMLEETNIVSLLDSVPDKYTSKTNTASYDHDHSERKDSSEIIVNEPEINLNEMAPSYEVKEELDLVEMINQVNI